jgi:hypothetical protein
LKSLALEGDNDPITAMSVSIPEEVIPEDSIPEEAGSTGARGVVWAVVMARG